MGIKKLKNRAEELNLKDRAKNCCYESLKNVDGGLPNNWILQKFEFEYKRVAVIIENAFLMEPYFEVEYLLFYSGAEVGNYRYIEDLNGECVDDYLAFY